MSHIKSKEAEEEKSRKKRAGKALLMYSMKFTKEYRKKSWWYVLSTFFYTIIAFAGTLAPVHWSLKGLSGIFFGLLIVRSFVLYHDYLHGAILQKSVFARILMTVFGIFVLAPVTIWKRTHNHHHNNNSKLSNSGIGSYPLVSKKQFNAFSKKERALYLLARHPITIFFGYITLFILDFNIKSLILNPKNHWDSAVALFFHFTVGYFLYTYFGLTVLLISWIIPFMLADGLGAYLFFAQHNFPNATFKLNKDWDYFEAAIKSTSFLKMNKVMNWFTGNIGYHHVHHVNHRIPFYRLKEAMDAMEELQNPKTTTLKIRDIINCLKLKVWDLNKQELTGL